MSGERVVPYFNKHLKEISLRDWFTKSLTIPQRLAVFYQEYGIGTGLIGATGCALIGVGLEVWRRTDSPIVAIAGVAIASGVLAVGSIMGSAYLHEISQVPIEDESRFVPGMGYCAIISKEI